MGCWLQLSVGSKECGGSQDLQCNDGRIQVAGGISKKNPLFPGSTGCRIRRETDKDENDESLRCSTSVAESVG